MSDSKNEPGANDPVNFQIKVLNNSVVLDFGRQITWIGFTKAETLKIAKFMRKAALTLK